MPLENPEMSSEERGLVLSIAARLPELMDLALRLGAENLAERLALVEECAFSLLAIDGDVIPKNG